MTLGNDEQLYFGSEHSRAPETYHRRSMRASRVFNSGFSGQLGTLARQRLFRGASLRAAIVVAMMLSGFRDAEAESQANSENSLAPNLGLVGVELDPLTTPLGARNLFVYLEPPSLPHWSVSLGVFASDFPDRVDKLLSYRNRDQGFDIKVRFSPGLTVDYFLAETRHKWHVGLMTFLWRYEVERNGDVATFTNHVLLPRVGYRWFPFDSVNVYLDPFAGLMTEYKLTGDANLDGDEVKPTPIIPFATVHLGFHF